MDELQIDADPGQDLATGDPPMATIRFRCSGCGGLTPAVLVLAGPYSYLGNQPGDVGSLASVLDILGIEHWREGDTWFWRHHCPADVTP